MKRTLSYGLIVGWILMASTSPFAQEARRLLQNYETVITVYGERLPLTERKILDAEANLTVLTRQDIEDSGAQTLQEVLAGLPGVVLHEQTGNPAEGTVDVRGFPRGTSLAVYLDGVRLNDLQDNSVRWDVVPLEDVERIEVYRGAAGPLYGGGALAGVVTIITRRNKGIPRLDLEGAAGSFGEREGRLHLSGASGSVEFYATAMKRRARGWRENDGYRLDDGLLGLRFALDDRQSLSFLAKYAGGEESAPGALTAEELAVDRRQSPYNRFDGNRGRHRLASLRYDSVHDSGWSFSAQIYRRTHDRDTLTTGRFGSGFFTSGRERLTGGTLESKTLGASGPWTWQTSAGIESAEGRFDGRGSYTDILGENKTPATSTTVRHRLDAIYAQGDFGWKAFHLVAGGRTDRTRYDYSDRFVPANDTSRTFRESTWKIGTLVHPGPASSLFLTYSQGYRIPSVVDLFAYPGFYSNPDLKATRASDWELGWRYLQNGRRLSVTAYRMRMKNEVVFVLTRPRWFLGQNRNVGRSTREGVEAEAHWPLPGGFGFHAMGSYQEPKVTAGPYAGHRVPMTPRYQGTVGALWSNPDWRVSLSARWVGPQMLDNDLEGRRPSLPGYATVEGTVRYTVGALTAEASVSNILNRAILNRGITNGFTDYYTPAYPSSIRLALTWSF